MNETRYRWKVDTTKQQCPACEDARLSIHRMALWRNHLMCGHVLERARYITPMGRAIKKYIKQYKQWRHNQ